MIRVNVKSELHYTSYFSLAHTRLILSKVQFVLYLKNSDLEHFAYKCDYTPATFHNWKAGRRRMHTDILHEIADALHMTPGELIRLK